MFEITRQEDVEFAVIDGVALTLDLYVPVTDKPVPLLVFFHGGGLEGGDKADCEPNALELARQGIAVAMPNYRLYPRVSYPAFLEDAASAVRWVAAYAARELTCAGLFVGGHSAGAYLAMMLCLDGRWLGNEGLKPADLSGFIFASGQPTTHFNILNYRGEDPRRAMIDETAALYHVTGSDGPPIQVLCADNDFPARLEQTQLLVATLKHYEYASEIDFQILEGHDHGSYLETCPDTSRTSIFLERAAPFIRRHATA